jgi:phage gpG-like protein
MGKTKHQFIDVKLPNGYSDDIKEAIAAEIISVIRKRTLKNKDKDGESFPSYSKEYVKSVDFKAAGKSKGDINLTLSGDMLASIELLEKKKNKVVIGFEEGTVQNAKADGNIRGTYGRPSPIKGKARPFLGISDDELEKILNKYPKDEEGEARADAVLKAQDKIDKRLKSIDINELSSDEVDTFFTLQIGEK